MRLKEQKFGKEEDYNVIKFIMRLCKEELYESKISNAFSDKRIRHLVRSCKSSRETHTNESQFMNYSYWPGDSGIMWPECISMVYTAMLIENYYEKFSETEKRNFKSTFLQRINRTIINSGNEKMKLNIFEEHFPLIGKALSKVCLGEINDIMKYVVSNIGSFKSLPL